MMQTRWNHVIESWGRCIGAMQRPRPPPIVLLRVLKRMAHAIAAGRALSARSLVSGTGSIRAARLCEEPRLHRVQRHLKQSTHVDVCQCVFVCLCTVWMYGCMDVCMHVCMYVRMSVWMCGCVCARSLAYIHGSNRWNVNTLPAAASAAAAQQ